MKFIHGQIIHYSLKAAWNMFSSFVQENNNSAQEYLAIAKNHIQFVSDCVEKLGEIESDNSEMISVHCLTNLDKFSREKWPQKLPHVPEIGHQIESENGAILKIVSLTWSYNGVLIIDLHYH